jgi:hypothetical protein
MAKKVRRVRRPRAGSANSAPADPAASPRQSSEEELQEQYAYVLKDLRRIFILAVAMFALLILLNLVLR